MRASIVHILVVLLIAVFASGSLLPAQADCAKCEDCSVEAPAKNEAPCPQKGLACQMVQTCVSQKVPSQLGIHPLVEVGEATFGLRSAMAIKSAYLTPETAPPRL